MWYAESSDFGSMHLVGMVCVTIDPSHVSFLVALNRPNPRQGRIVAVSFFWGETPPKKKAEKEKALTAFGFPFENKKSKRRKSKTKKTRFVAARNRNSKIKLGKWNGPKPAEPAPIVEFSEPHPVQNALVTTKDEANLCPGV